MKRLKVLPPEAVSLLRRFLQQTDATRRSFLIPTGLTFVASAFEAGTWSLLLPLADAVKESGYGFLATSPYFGWMLSLAPEGTLGSSSEVGYFTGLIVVLLLLARGATVTVGYLRGLYMQVRNQRYSIQIASLTFAHVLGFGRQYFTGEALGGVDARISWASGSLGLVTQVEEAIRHLVSLVVKVVMMLVLSVPLSLAFLFTIPFVAAGLRWMNERIRRIAAAALANEQQRRARKLDILATIPLVKAYSQEATVGAAFREVLEEGSEISLRSYRVGSLRGPFEEMVVLLVVFSIQTAMMYATPDFQIAQLALFAAFLLLLQQSLPDLRAINDLWGRLAAEGPRYEAVEELFSVEGKYMVPSGPREFRGLDEGIELNGLDFEYRTGALVLRGVRAKIPSRRVTAIVGESGAGKTTLVDVIARFFDCPAGTVLMDGVDIRDFSLESLHRNMAIVSQEVWLLNDSVRANLTFGLDHKPTDEELFEVLRDVELGPFLAGLPAGLDTLIGDRGVRLSGGQRQRMGLAQAVLRKPGILILDEATSALDSVIEERVGRAIRKRTEGQTVVMIAHRLSTIRDADLILVLDDGQVVESGTWNELLHQGGAFARLHRAQVQAPPMRAAAVGGGA